jgi:hypothetical protein
MLLKHSLSRKYSGLDASFGKKKVSEKNRAITLEKELVSFP